MQSNPDIVRAFFDSMSTEGVRAALSRHAATDMIWWSAGAGAVQDKIADFMDAFGAEVTGEFELAIQGVTADGDRVAVEVSLMAELSGERLYSNRFHFLFALYGGLITRINEYHDTRHAYITIGPTLRKAGFIDD